MNSWSLLLLLPLFIRTFSADLVSIVHSPEGTVNIPACSNKTILSCRVAEVNPDVLDDDEINLPGHLTLPKAEEGAMDKDANETTNHFNDKKGNMATFTRLPTLEEGVHVIGAVIYADDRVFLLEPCLTFDGCHVWMEKDMSDFNLDDLNMELNKDQQKDKDMDEDHDDSV